MLSSIIRETGGEKIVACCERVALDAQALQILKQTIQYFEDKYKQAYLVGGSLRNLLLGEPTIDWDIVTMAMLTG